MRTGALGRFDPVTAGSLTQQLSRSPVAAELHRIAVRWQTVVPYISYESVQELAEQPYLTPLSDSVLDEYAEEAE